MQEDRPPLPGIIERQGKLLDVLHDPEAAERVRMLEGIAAWSYMLRNRRADAGGKVQQRFGGFGGQVSRNLQ